VNTKACKVIADNVGHDHERCTIQSYTTVYGTIKHKICHVNVIWLISLEIEGRRRGQKRNYRCHRFGDIRLHVLSFCCQWAPVLGNNIRHFKKPMTWDPSRRLN